MSKLQAYVIPVTPFQQNCSLIFDEDTKIGAVVDPGGDVARIRAAIAESGVTVEKILLTHGHIDHAGGAAALREALGVPIEGPNPEDLFLLESLPESGAKYGMSEARAVVPDRWLKEGDRVNLEVDMIGKYVEKLLAEQSAGNAAENRINPAFLAQHGFL